ncbi:MAG: hypothetical protein LBD24_01095 [Spirochaetaceae bacterium]|jgi:hypothetical protein|nr:hypothetical protein [Spirochaetaceae bacterium]
MREHQREKDKKKPRSAKSGGFSGGRGRNLALRALFFLLAAVSDTEDHAPPALESGTVPDSIRAPQRGEAPRYPRDTVIGVLGSGEAPEEAYRFALAVLNGVLVKDAGARALGAADPAFLEDLFTTLEPVNPRKFRIGGGREEPDGSVSFLVRFVGREQWVAGELYLRFTDDLWRVDDLILEEPHDTGTAPSYTFDFSPYERFF